MISRASSKKAPHRPGRGRSAFNSWSRSIFLALLVGLPAASPVAEPVRLAPGAPSSYTVVPGDTLWGVAGRFLSAPERWSEIWDANPGVKNPNLIYPGDVLELYYRDGQPRIRRGGGGGGGMRTVKLSPRVRVETIERAIPAVQLSVIAPFLSRPFVADSQQIERAPYVVGFPDEHILAGVGDTFYVRSIKRAKTDRFEVLRPGEPLKDPESDTILGYAAHYVGSAKLLQTGDPAKLQIERMELEISIGDRVIPADRDSPIKTFIPSPAPRNTVARIISVLNGVSQIGRYNVVILNKGERDRIKPGHVFHVYNGGGKRRDDVASRTGGWGWRETGRYNELDDQWPGGRGDWSVKTWLWDEPNPNEPYPLHRGYPEAIGRNYPGEIADAVQEQFDNYKDRETYYTVPYEQSGVLMVFRTFERVSFALVMRARRAMHVLDTASWPRY